MDLVGLEVHLLQVVHLLHLLHPYHLLQVDLEDPGINIPRVYKSTEGVVLVISDIDIRHNMLCL